MDRGGRENSCNIPPLLKSEIREGEGGDGEERGGKSVEGDRK